jgi:hypothetical protein
MKLQNPQTTGFDRLLLRLEAPPWYAIYRIGIGFLVLPALSRLAGEDHSAGTLLAFLLGVLALLRAAPMLIRKVLPVSPQVHRIWFERRRIAKRYDSYQWRKLFWIGLGLAISFASTGEFPVSGALICSFLLLSGALGLIQWRLAVARFAWARHTARIVGDMV